MSWTTITTGADSSPYLWDLTSVPNTTNARVRIRVKDNGSPPFTGYDASDASFSIVRAGGDLIGPAVVAGSIRTNPNPIVNTATASLTASLTDAQAGGSNVAAAEWSAGSAPAAAGAGRAMSGTFTAPTVNVNATIAIGTFTTGDIELWVRGRDAAGNWGGARQLAVHVNGDPSVAVQTRSPSCA